MPIGYLVNDVVDEQKDDVRKVREFLYVDHQRIRSYYAQINRGVIESIISRGSQHVEGEVGVRLFGFGPSASGGRESEREESRSLQDLNYVIFEELFEKEGLIRDITAEADDAQTWESGRIYSAIDEGDIVRYTGNFQILDPEFVRDRFGQFGKLASAIAGSQIGPQEPQRATPPGRQGGGTKPGQRARTAEEVRADMKAAKIAEMTGGVAGAQLSDLMDFVDAFTNNAITVRVLPLGPSRSEYHFAGTLLSRNEYIQPEREALFGRYGTHLEDWTIVMQIARIPSEASQQAPDFSESAVNNDVFSRGVIEKMMTSIIGYMEALGIAEGARYPAISVTVLAIYREFA